jgi:hypothetical protein
LNNHCMVAQHPPDLMIHRVVLKIVGTQHPIPVTVQSFTDRGIWARDKTLQSNCYPSTNLPPMPLGNSPWIFAPLSQIEWLIVPDRDGQAT